MSKTASSIAMKSEDMHVFPMRSSCFLTDRCAGQDENVVADNFKFNDKKDIVSSFLDCSTTWLTDRLLCE